MTIGATASLRTTWVTAIGTAAGNAAKLYLMSGTRPATGGLTEVPMVTFTCGSPFITSVSSGVATLTAIASVGASGGGTAPGTAATWARLRTSGGTFVMDLSVGPTGSGADIELDSVYIVAGATIAITSGTITAPGA